MRWKEGSTNFSSGSVNIIGDVPSVCVFDNGTTACDLGYIITTPGSCFSQGIGTINSGGNCVSDYVGTLFSSFVLYNEQNGVDGTYSVVALNGVSGFYENILTSVSISYSEWISVKSLEKNGIFDIVILSTSPTGSYNEYLVQYGAGGTFKLAQFDSGSIVRFSNSTSEYYQLDVFGAAIIIHPHFFSGAESKDINIITETTISSSFETVVSGIGVSDGTVNPLEGSDNPVDICVGDLMSPYIDNVLPASGSVLNNESQEVSFDIVDAIGGVNKSSIYITVSGNTSTQPEGTSIVSGGVPISQASLVGSDSKYSFTYLPTNDWSYNEVVTVTVTGTDNVPNDSEGNPFSCYTGEPNQFGESWHYKIRNYDSFNASIVAIADITPPYIENIIPPRWRSGVNYLDDISFNILDDHAGVDLSTIFVYINGSVVIQYGEIIDSSASLIPISNGYHFYYTNSDGFPFGSRVTIRVVAYDLYATSPNKFDYSYYFDIVGTDTMSIENFYPLVGITTEPEDVDLQVDVIDRVYDIDDSDLYLSINGDVVAADKQKLYGIRDLTTVSGYTTVTGSVSYAYIYDGYLSNVVVSGTSVLSKAGSSVDGGHFGVGGLTNISDPYSNTVSGTVISGTIIDGVFSSAVLETTLVSGVNWNGDYNDANLYGVDLSLFNSTLTSISGTVISGSWGYQLSYHPTNDFNYQGAINVLVHGTNLSSLAPVTLEHLYQLFYGYNVKVFDRTFLHNKKVNVYVGASNSKNFQNRLDYGYYFETMPQPHDDMAASIVGIAPWVDLEASISPQAPVYRYGDTISVEIYVDDMDGNSLGPYVFSYTIESL